MPKSIPKWRKKHLAVSPIEDSSVVPHRGCLEGNFANHPLHDAIFMEVGINQLIIFSALAVTVVTLSPG